MKEDISEIVGLTDGEAKLYIALLELGSTTAGNIIRKTGFHRGTTYQIMQRLIDKGLVSFVVKGKKRYFEAAEPEQLLDVLRDKEDALKEMIPKLKAKQLSAKEKQEVVVYEGIDGIRTVFDRMFEELKKGGEYYDFGVSGLFKEIMPSYWKLWQKRKRKFRIKSKCIFNEKIKIEDPELLKKYYGSAKFHAKEFFSPTDTIIFKDTVVLIIWTAKPPIAIVIKNKDNANGYRQQFALMWKNAKK